MTADGKVAGCRCKRGYSGLTKGKTVNAKDAEILSL
jgi:hypothetical protein